MSWLEGTRARLRLLFARRAAESRMEAEFRFHLEMETERLVREQGLEPGEARRRALVAFGGVEKHKEELRDGRGLAWLGGLSLDVKLGFRMLRRYPGLTLVATLALAVAIGAGAGYLELLHDVFHPTLPIEDGDRIVRIENWDVAKGEIDPRALHDFMIWREELGSVEELGATLPFERNLITDDGRVEPVEAREISASAFRLFRLRPLLGRPLLDADERPGAPAVVVIGEGVWRARFGADSGVIGRTIQLGSSLHTVVGVMPASFPSSASLWVPLRLDGAVHGRGEGPGISVFGRLAPGVALDRAQAELATISTRATAASPDTLLTLRPRIVSYLEPSGEDMVEMRIMYTLNIFFLGLLGVCCANVATLVFARTATREGELTVRTALGASRGRIVAQLFAEAIVLTTVAAAIGLTAAAYGLQWASHVIVDAEGGTLPFWWNDRLSVGTLLYAGTLAVVAAVIIGVVPARKATGRHVQAGLKHAAGGSRMHFGRLWTGVIVTQVALTVIFLFIVVSVGWNVRVGRYLAGEIALPAEEYLTARLEMDADSARNGSADSSRSALVARFEATYGELEQRLLAEPDVAGVTYASRLPGVEQRRLRIEVDGAAPPREGAAARSVRTAAVDANFFDTIGATILSGRAFNAGDLAPDRHVAVVDQSFVALVLDGRNPLGQRVRQLPRSDREEPGPWIEIVGVVRDLAVVPDKAAEDVVLYRPAAAAATSPLSIAIHLRGRADPRSLAPRLRGVAVAVDPTLRLYDVMPMSEIGRSDRVVFGIIVRIIALVGAVVLLLSTAGVHSLMSFTVTRRTREIGIRTALGAVPQRVVTGIFSRAFAQVGLGVLAGTVPGGLLVAFGFPEGVRGAGLAVAVGATLAVATFTIGVGVLASVVPARRALRIQPTEALRADG